MAFLTVIVSLAIQLFVCQVVINKIFVFFFYIQRQTPATGDFTVEAI